MMLRPSRRFFLIAALLSGAAFFAPGAQAQRTPAPPPQFRPVYVDTLLQMPTTQQTGNSPFRPVTATLDGVNYGRSLLTEVNNNATATSQYASLTISLNNKFERFQVTVGRDDTLAARGPGYCFFEVYADGKRVFRSMALRSALTPVKTGVRGGPKASAPQRIDISVRGVRSLRLLTRYALEFSQEARYVNRAMGCVWGAPRLIFASDAPPEVVVQNAGVRQAVREAAQRLAGTVANLPAYKGRAEPFQVGVTPLRVDPNPPADEPAVRALIANELGAQRRAEKRILEPLLPSDAAALAAALPIGGSARLSPGSVAAIGRGNRADFVILGALTRTAGRWQILLRLIETKDGAVIEQVTVAVPGTAAGGE